jgi:uncharacterized membrane protein
MEAIMNLARDLHSEDGSIEREAAFLPLDRFIAFSDGVFAIAITLLVLELPVPPNSVPLLAALLEQWPEFLGYFISFAFIGGIWISHAGLTKLMKRGDAVAYGINLLVLLFVALLPFTTRLMITHLSGPDVGIAVLLYGINVILDSLTLSFLMFYVAREPSLRADDFADTTLKQICRQRWIAIGLNIIAIAMALVVPLVAVGLYLVVTALFLVVPLVSLRRHRHQPTAG